MKLLVKTIGYHPDIPESHKYVEVKGEPWEFGSNMLLFPAHHVVLLNAYNFVKYYDHIEDCWDSDVPDSYIKNLLDTLDIYDLTDNGQVMRCLQKIYQYAKEAGKHEIQFGIRKLIGG